MDFGMEGADIVAGSSQGGVRQLYAAIYTGPPIVDASLKLLGRFDLVDIFVLLKFGAAQLNCDEYF